MKAPSSELFREYCEYQYRFDPFGDTKEDYHGKFQCPYCTSQIDGDISLAGEKIQYFCYTCHEKENGLGIECHQDQIADLELYKTYRFFPKHNDDGKEFIKVFLDPWRWSDLKIVQGKKLGEFLDENLDSMKSYSYYNELQRK